jgi:general secretion pathway protein H
MEARTTSRTGDAGFTLLEVLLALGVIALIAVVLIGGSARLLAGRTATPNDVFWEAVSRSRKRALQNGHEVRLSFNDKTKAFVISDGGAADTLPIPKPPPDFGVTFISTETTGAEELIAGTLTATQGLTFVSFYADGTCTPFRIQMHTPTGAHLLSIDPWTCAPVLNPLNPDGTPLAKSS